MRGAKFSAARRRSALGVGIGALINIATYAWAQQATVGTSKLDAAAPELPPTPFETARSLNLAGGPFKQRIINPEPADYSKNRWQVALVLTEFSNNFRAQFCGGSYLGGRWVVTAAHCAIQSKLLFAVFYGSGKLDTSGKRVAIRDVWIHPNYSRRAIAYDIALLELASPINVDSVVLVTKAQASTLQPGSKVRVTGWGVINEVGINSQDLMQAELPLQSPVVCNASDAYNGKVPPDMMCAGEEAGGPDTCKGDSGGPATLTVAGGRKLVAIVSTGTGCGAPKKYGIYTRIGTYEEWIHTTIQKASAPAP